MSEKLNRMGAKKRLYAVTDEAGLDYFLWHTSKRAAEATAKHMNQSVRSYLNQHIDHQVVVYERVDPA